MHVGQTALAAVDPIRMRRHENACATSISWTFPPQPLNLSIRDLVILEHGHLDLLVLMLDLLWFGVRLLLPFLTTTEQTGQSGNVGKVRNAKGRKRGRVGGDIDAGMEKT